MIKRTTLKEIRKLATVCEDITKTREDYWEQLREQEGHLDVVIISVGTYGINGKILQGANTKKMYAITNRTPVMWYFG